MRHHFKHTALLAAALALASCGEELDRQRDRSPGACAQVMTRTACLDAAAITSQRAYFDERNRLVLVLEGDGASPAFRVHVELGAAVRRAAPELWQLGEVAEIQARLFVEDDDATAEPFAGPGHEAMAGLLSLSSYDPGEGRVTGRLIDVVFDAAPGEARPHLGEVALDIDCIGAPLEEDPCEETCGICRHEDQCGGVLYRDVGHGCDG